MSQNQPYILDEIPVDIPYGEVRRQLHMKKDERWDAAKLLVENAHIMLAIPAGERQRPSLVASVNQVAVGNVLLQRVMQ